MTKVKVYQSLVGQIHHTSVKVDGKEVNITFSGADGDNLGTLTTVDEKLQKAIESDPAYNIRFKFIKEYGDNNSNSGMVGPGKIIPGPLNGEKLSENGLVVGEDGKGTEPAKGASEVLNTGNVDNITDSKDEGGESADLTKGEPETGATESGNTGGAPEGDNTDLTGEGTNAPEGGNTGEDKNGDNDKSKTFKTLNEAQEFFCAEPYNLTKTSIRTTSAVVEAGKALGIEVIFSRE